MAELNASAIFRSHAKRFESAGIALQEKSARAQEAMTLPLEKIRCLSGSTEDVKKLDRKLAEIVDEVNLITIDIIRLQNWLEGNADDQESRQR